MGPTAGLSNAIAAQINERMGSTEASKFVEFAASTWPEHLPFATRPDEENPKLKQIAFGDRTWIIPARTYWSHLHRMSLGYHSFILNKYSLPGFCEVEDGDVVLDCGSFIGGFASACAAKARRVIAVEPSPVNSVAASANLSRYANVDLVQCALWNECTNLTFNISETAIDDGLLEPDHGAPVERVEVEAISVSELARRQGIARFDFMKIEAEGVELEILNGVGGLNSNRIAIDCAPERGGQSPAAEVIDLLHRHGFETQQKGIVVFARRSERNESGTTVLQTSTATEPNRYPEIFDEAIRVYPDAKSVLSYGCSTGDELETLARRWPDASIAGVEILPSAREAAKSRFPHLKILSPDELANEKFDVITAMSVLYRWPEISEPLPFPLFENAINQIDGHLNPGGLLLAFNATYNPSSVLTDYEALQFQPQLKLPSNSKSRLIVLPREPNGTPSISPHPILFRKPTKVTARRRDVSNIERDPSVTIAVKEISISDRLKREMNHVASTTSMQIEDFTDDQVRLIEKVLERQLALNAEAQQQVSRLQADLGQAIARIAGIEASNSWRFTRPLRDIRRMLGC